MPDLASSAADATSAVSASPVLAAAPHRIGTISLVVRDLDTVSRFYKDAIGLNVLEPLAEPRGSAQPRPYSSKSSTTRRAPLRAARGGSLLTACSSATAAGLPTIPTFRPISSACWPYPGSRGR